MTATGCSAAGGSTDGRHEAMTAERRQSTILGIHSGALGDVVLFGQFLRALRGRAGGPVQLVAGGDKARLLVGLGAADEAMDFDALPMAEVFSGAPPEDCLLPGRLGRCDLLVSCFAAGDAAAQKRLTALASAGRSLFLPIRPPAGHPGHLLDLWGALAETGPVPPPGWLVPDRWRRRARLVLSEAGGDADTPYLLIHPGSGSRTKCWPLERFVEAAKRLSRAPVFVLGPTELDWWGQQIIESLRKEFPTLLCPPLEVLAALAAGARAYLGNDSGPTQLAAAVGTPTVALFGPTRPDQFAPRGRRAAVVADSDMQRISVEAVTAAMENF